MGLREVLSLQREFSDKIDMLIYTPVIESPLLDVKNKKI